MHAPGQGASKASRRTKRVLIILFAIGAIGLPARLFAAFNIGNKAQLFVDRFLVDEVDGVSFTQHQGTKVSQNPLIVADRPWEGWRVCLYGSAMYDEEENLFKMWYYAEGSPNYFDNLGALLCYATSTDGIHWEKPLVGTLPTMNGLPTNAVGYLEAGGVIKDLNDPDPSHRYKMIGWDMRPDGPQCYGTFVSPDGLNWTSYSTSPIAPDRDVINGFYDESRGRFVALSKKHMTWDGHVRRLFRTSVSQDFIHWTQPVLSFKTDALDDAGAQARIDAVRPLLDRPDDPNLMRTEFYGVGTYQAESCIIGFPQIFTVNNNARWGNHEGPIEVQLAVTRDLMNWEHPFRTPVISRDGNTVDTWDAGIHQTSSAFLVEDAIYLYYGGANYTHGTPALYRETFEDGSSTGRRSVYNGSIGLVTWQRDRFVSVDALVEGGSLTTIPIRFNGDRLELNAVTHDEGSIVVEICDATGERLPDYPLSDPFSGDDLRHTITFGGVGDV